MAETNINMKADDSAMVDDILNELNQTSNQNLDELMKEDTMPEMNSSLPEMDESQFIEEETG
jgi:hypothetical protein